MSTGPQQVSNDERASTDELSASLGAGVAGDDRLTTRRLLIITAGVALGLVIFVPRDGDADFASVDWWRQIWFALLAGVALVSPLFVIGRRIRAQRAGVGGMLLLTLGFGVLLLVPTAIAERSHNPGDSFSTVCLTYCVPFVCLWYLIAAAVGGQLTRASLGRSTPWVERLGLYLALAGAPLGVWLLIDIYREAF